MKKQNIDLNEDEFLDNTIRKNKPNLFFPILSTIFSIALFVAIIVLFVKKEVGVPFLVFGTVITFLCGLSSWYTNFFAKKKNIAKLDTFQEESEKLLKYTNKFRGYKTEEITSNSYPEFELIFDENLELTKFSYDKTNHLINQGETNGIFLTFGIAVMGIIVNKNTNVVDNVGGFIPSSIFYTSKLHQPNSKKGIVKVKTNLLSNMIYMFFKDSNLYYDPKTNWLCVGNKKWRENDIAIEFMENAILVFKDDQVDSFWIKLD